MNSGRAELDIVAVAQDQATAVLKSVDKGLSDTAKGMEKVAAEAARAGQNVTAANDRIKTSVDGFKDKIKPIDMVREGFNKLRENLGFVATTATVVGSAVIGVVSGIAKLVSGSDRVEIALKRWRENQGELNKTIERGKDLLEVFSRTPLEEALTNVNIQLRYTRELAAEIKGDKDEWRAKLAQINELTGIQIGLQRKINEEHDVRLRKLVEIKAATERVNIATAHGSDIIFGSRKGEFGYDPSLDFETDPVTGEILTPEIKAARKRKLDAALARLKGGGGGGRARDLSNAPSATALGTDAGGMKPYTEWIGPMVDEAIPGLDLMSITLDREAEAFGKMAKETDKLTESILRLGEGLAEIANISAPELGGMLSELTSLTERYQAQTQALADKVKAGTISGYEAEKKAAQARTQAIIGSSTAGVAAIAKSIGGLKAEYVVRSIGEAAAAAASYGVGDIAGGTNHALASTLYAVAAGTSSPAAGAGGGGGNATASSRGTPFGGGSGQPMTVVYQFSTLLADEAGVKRATNQVERGLRRTGIGAREAA